MTSKKLPPRPLSPHLQVYRMGLPAILSILHRLSGLIVYGGCVIWTALLIALAVGYGNCAHQLVNSFLGISGAFIWTVALYYHLFNGIRHLFWDLGKGFELEVAYRSGWAVVGVSLTASLVTWIMLLNV